MAISRLIYQSSLLPNKTLNFMNSVKDKMKKIYGKIKEMKFKEQL